jgi:hypothetical protein
MARRRGSDGAADRHVLLLGSRLLEQRDLVGFFCIIVLVRILLRL